MSEMNKSNKKKELESGFSKDNKKYQETGFDILQKKFAMILIFLSVQFLTDNNEILV